MFEGNPNVKYMKLDYFAPNSQYGQELRQLSIDVNASGADCAFIVNRRAQGIIDMTRTKFAANIETYSDLAIPWLPSLKDRKIAVIDDCIRTGATANNVIDHLVASGADVGNISVHSIFTTNDPNMLLHGDIKPNLVVKKAVSREEYKKRIQDIVIFLSIYPLAYEYEYPKFYCRYQSSLGNWRDAIKHLLDAFGHESVFKADLFTRMHPTMSRLSINICPPNGAWKIRCHLHDDTRTAILVPITTAFHVDPSISHFSALRKHAEEILAKLDPARENFQGETAARFEQYINSTEAFLMHIDKFYKIFSFEDEIVTRLTMHDARLIFGEDMAKDIIYPIKLMDPKSVRWNDISPQKLGELSAFSTKFMKGKYGKDFMDLLMLKISKKAEDGFKHASAILHALYEAFDEFVNNPEMLNKLVNTDGFHPNAEEIKNNPYLMNLIGLSFEDIITITSKIFYNRNLQYHYGENAAYVKICEQMDIDIDSGSIIPAIGMERKTVYRRGEGALQDKFAILAMKTIDAAEGIELGKPVTLAGLPEDKRSHVTESLLFLDTWPMWMGL
jgi:hypothetical protein